MRQSPKNRWAAVLRQGLRCSLCWKANSTTGAICPSHSAHLSCHPCGTTHTFAGRCRATGVAGQAHTEHQNLPLRLLLLLLPMLAHHAASVTAHAHTFQAPIEAPTRPPCHTHTHTQRQKPTSAERGLGRLCKTPAGRGVHWRLDPEPSTLHPACPTLGRPHKPGNAAAAAIYADISCTPGTNQYRNATAPQLPWAVQPQCCNTGLTLVHLEKGSPGSRGSALLA